MFSFDAPGAAPDATAASGINAGGQIVGGYVDVNGNSHGFLAEGATFTQLDCPGALRTMAWVIDSVGQIAGTCDTATQRRRNLAINRTQKRLSPNLKRRAQALRVF
jgi:probable HAF family extracellular repeat protein